MSLNPAHGEVYSIQNYVIVCQWLAKGRWFSPDTTISTTNKTDSHDITEIVLKVTLNTINSKPIKLSRIYRCYIQKFDSMNTTVWNTKKNVDIQFSAHECTTSFWNNFIRYAQNRKIVKPNKIIKHIYASFSLKRIEERIYIGLSRYPILFSTFLNKIRLN